MNKSGHTARQSPVTEYAGEAAEEMKRYCAARPESPSALSRPQLFLRGDLWIALLGPNVEQGIVGIGPTIAAALRAFDAQYLAGRHPPNERSSSSHKPGPSFTQQRTQLPEC